MAKQAVKKGAGVKKSGIAAYKEKHGLNYQNSGNGTNSEYVSNAEKPMEWLLLPKCWQEGLGLPGVPCGYVVSAQGFSNTGKSTFIGSVLAAASKQGYISVIFDTENNFSFEYAKRMGFECEPVYGDIEVEVTDSETGEITKHIERQIVSWEGEFIYMNSQILADQYGDWDYSQGKKVSKKRKEAVLEDIAMCISDLLEAQENGEIDKGMVFVWDSVGSIGCYKEYASAKLLGNNMWSANAISVAFNKIWNSSIPGSRRQRIDKNGNSIGYTNTMVMVNKVWLDSSSNPVGPAIMTPKCGKSATYASRLIFGFGGALTAGIKRITATAKGNVYNVGIETRVRVLKNHLGEPFSGCMQDAKLIACDYGFIGLDELDEYKKKHLPEIIKKLKEISGNNDITEKDVVFSEEVDEGSEE